MGKSYQTTAKYNKAYFVCIIHYSDVDYLLNSFSRLATREALQAICGGNPAAADGFPSPRASNTETVSMSLPHHIWMHCMVLKHIEAETKWPPFPDIFKYILLNENVRISIKTSLQFVLKSPINNFPALDQIMACRRPGDKPLSEPMMVYITDAYMRHSASMS